MEQRRSFAVTADGKKMQPVEGVDRYALAQAPIVAAGDVCGSLMFLAGDSPAPATETEIKLIQAGASFLGRQMEEERWRQRTIGLTARFRRVTSCASSASLSI